MPTVFEQKRQAIDKKFGAGTSQKLWELHGEAFENKFGFDPAVDKRPSAKKAEAASGSDLMPMLSALSAPGYDITRLMLDAFPPTAAGSEQIDNQYFTSPRTKALGWLETNMRPSGPEWLQNTSRALMDVALSVLSGGGWGATKAAARAAMNPPKFSSDPAAYRLSARAGLNPATEEQLATIGPKIEELAASSAPPSSTLAGLIDRVPKFSPSPLDKRIASGAGTPAALEGIAPLTPEVWPAPSMVRRTPWDKLSSPNLEVMRKHAMDVIEKYGRDSQEARLALQAWAEENKRLLSGLR